MNKKKVYPSLGVPAASSSGDRESSRSEGDARSRLLQLTDRVPGVVIEWWISDDQSSERVHYVGGNVEELWGLSPETLKSSPELFWAQVDESELIDLRQVIKEAGEKGSAFRHAYAYAHPVSGELKWMLAQSGRPQPSENGILWPVRIIDLTEQKLVEGELREAQAVSEAARISEQQTSSRMRALFELSSDGYAFYSESRRLHDPNPAMLRLFRCETADEFEGLQPWGALSPPFQPDGRSSPEKAFRQIEKALRNESGDGYWRFEWQHRRLDQDDFDAEVTLVPLPAEHEQVFLAIIRDITETKALQDALTLSKESAEASAAAAMAANKRIVEVNDNIFGAVWRAEIDVTNSFAPVMRYTDFSGRIETVLGDFDVRSVMTDAGRFLDWVHPTDHAFFQGAIAQSLSTGTFVTEYRTRRAGGVWGWAKAVGTTYTSKNDLNLLTAVGIITDIDQERSLREELAIATADAEDANRAKSAFLANMSHEIRTPMNAIIGMTHLAQKTALDARQQDYLGKIDRAAKNLLGIINDILDFSKIEAGRLDMENIEFDLSEVLENLFQLCGIKADAKGLDFHLRAPPDLPRALIGDPLRLGQILTNFATNAIKFTESGRVVVSVSVVAGNAKEVVLKFACQDTGIGLTREQVSRLFQDFSQAETSVSRKFGGTGLGLAISRQLAELMGGTVGVESTPGSGATFWATVRFSRAQFLKPRFQSVEAFRGMQVMVVEQSTTCGATYAEYLESFGCNVRLAEDWHQALSILGSGLEIQLILVGDLESQADRLRLVREIQSRTVQPAPQLILTASSSFAGNDEDLMRELGVGAFLARPVSPGGLFDAVVTRVGLAGGASAGSGDAADLAAAHLKGTRVLLAEDNELNQQVAKGILEEVGIDLAIVVNGQDAVEAVRQAHQAGREFELILMDIQMPVMDGIAATAEIRRDSRNASIPIISTSANAMKADRDACMAAGMNDHVAKPLNVDDLFKVLMKWIRSKGRVEPTETDPGSGMSGGLASGELPRIRGIMKELGLSRVGGNPGRYKETLRVFRSSQADVPQQIEAAMQAGDRDLAERLAHTLRSTSGTVGAEALQHLAGDLETAIRKEESDGPMLLAKIKSELNLILQSMDMVLPEPAAQVISTAEDALEMPPFDRSLLDDIALQIADGDSSAADSVARLIKQLGGASPPALLKLAKAIDNFDFELSRSLLNQLQSAFE